MTPLAFEIDSSLAGERVGTGVSRLLGISRTKAQQLCELGAVLISGKTVMKSDRLELGDRLAITQMEESSELEVVSTPVDSLNVIFQDDYIVVVDKPAGVVAHPTVGFDGPTVPGALMAMGISLTTSGAAERQGIVQRLDVGTSGLMVLAKEERAYSVLKQAFRDRTVHKTYHAIIQGHPDPLAGTFDAPIARHPKAEFKFQVADGGKPSVTHYKTLEMFPAASLVEVELETGRTHQIRVHFSAFRHPLVGDTMYGADPTLAKKLGLERQWLHATGLSFSHPISGEEIRFSSQYPEDLSQAVEQLRSRQGLG
jgi:23S rRNA pseudouridine1911/1915/1917 synthase